MNRDFACGSAAAGEVMLCEHLAWVAECEPDICSLEPVVNAQLAAMTAATMQEGEAMNSLVARTAKLAWMMGYWWAKTQEERP